MSRIPALLVSLALSTILVACGGSSSRTDAGAQSGSTAGTITAAEMQVAADYHPIVQQLYVAYFGRPADPSGLANFAAELATLQAPADIQALNAAYDSNPALRALIDTFGISDESKALFSGDTRTFITAIYDHVLNRTPDQDGLTFWANAVDRGALTRAHASFSIMAGALANATPQGRLDAQLIGWRITAATAFTASLTDDATVKAYKGNTAATIARNMLSTITAASDMAKVQTAIDSTRPLLLVAAPPPPSSAPPAPFSAVLGVAPAEGAIISAPVRLEVHGNAIGNAELLPANGVMPIYARFNVSSDGTFAWLDLDPKALPAATLSFRVVVWNVPPGDAGQSIEVMPSRTWTIQHVVPPPPLAVALVKAPPDGATLSGIIELEVQGTSMENVELLPEAGYTPVLARFEISADKTTARVSFDTRNLPNALFRVRISAFDVPPGNLGASELIAMPVRNWVIKN
ncbi:MAG TPA: DUF4214 domain-containing protein [Noviherbaspirillum sp.]|uniref:DUF4214 domain-containing protein n=1 Tax=Noviherbaspirillum sp. TaxID=1926288 RepID=UPI002B49F4F7|nr:DUF4214 domain-containing protein [Noviherbaspirillum sp.]HJV84319.1 DUF4214 domain-containing protein [Noviherbaspirillum sp.]